MLSAEMLGFISFSPTYRTRSHAVTAHYLAAKRSRYSRGETPTYFLGTRKGDRFIFLVQPRSVSRRNGPLSCGKTLTILARRKPGVKEQFFQICKQ